MLPKMYVSLVLHKHSLNVAIEPLQVFKGHGIRHVASVDEGTG